MSLLLGKGSDGRSERWEHEAAEEELPSRPMTKMKIKNEFRGETRDAASSHVAFMYASDFSDIFGSLRVMRRAGPRVVEY